MNPRITEPSPPEDLFRTRLEDLISPRHSLVRLAERIDQAALGERLEDYPEDVEAGPALKGIRLKSGLVHLKHTHGTQKSRLSQVPPALTRSALHRVLNASTLLHWGPRSRAAIVISAK